MCVNVYAALLQMPGAGAAAANADKAYIGLAANGSLAITPAASNPCTHVTGRLYVGGVDLLAENAALKAKAAMQDATITVMRDAITDLNVRVIEQYSLNFVQATFAFAITTLSSQLGRHVRHACATYCHRHTCISCVGKHVPLRKIPWRPQLLSSWHARVQSTRYLHACENAGV